MNMRTCDVPVVFLSYDEPWADAFWNDLRAQAPQAKRVHGVAGLDACHKAAADVAESDWFLTVDADARISPDFFDGIIPAHLLNTGFRLDWPSRNLLTGIVSGNGCVKLWPRDLVRRMATHEAAPEGTVSVDHEIDAVQHGRTRKVIMPDAGGVTNPALTPYHAFRAGFREAAFLAHTARAHAARLGQGDWQGTGAGRVLLMWATLGRHLPNGCWSIYGARLALLMPHLAPGWDLRLINDYDWFRNLWDGHVVPRFSPGASRSDWTDFTWDMARLDDEIAAQAGRLHRLSGLDLAHIPGPLSAQITDTRDFSANDPASKQDGLAWALMNRTDAAENLPAIRGYLETAATLGHPAAFDNLAMLHLRGMIDPPDRAKAERLLNIAIALGNPHAKRHLEEMRSDMPSHGDAHRTAPQKGNVAAMGRAAQAP